MPDPVDREHAIAAILAEGRRTRKRPSRGLWIAAGVVGVAATVAFLVFLFSDGGTAVPRPEPRRERGGGFYAGLVLGLVVGIWLGIAIARQRHSSRNSP